MQHPFKAAVDRITFGTDLPTKNIPAAWKAQSETVPWGLVALGVVGTLGALAVMKASDYEFKGE
jgi:hypothetical protein